MFGETIDFVFKTKGFSLVLLILKVTFNAILHAIIHYCNAVSIQPEQIQACFSRLLSQVFRCNWKVFYGNVEICAPRIDLV